LNPFTIINSFGDDSIKIITVSLLPTVFVGHHFAQPRRVQAERSREVVSAPSGVSRRKQREPLNGEASRECYKIKKNRINNNWSFFEFILHNCSKIKLLIK